MLRCLILLFLIIGCTNEAPVGKGYFKSTGRMPASKQKDPDLLQTVVYCKTNSDKPSRCFNKFHHRKNKELYFASSRELRLEARKLYQKLFDSKPKIKQEQIQKCVGEFTEFHSCLQNAAVGINGELLSQFTVQNQDEHNGHEIHYLKNLYQEWILSDLEKAYLLEKGHEEKVVKKQLSLNIPQFTQDFLMNRARLKGATDWTIARDKCAESLPLLKLKYFTSEEYKTIFLKDYVCTDILYHPTLSSLIEKKAYIHFEKKLAGLFKSFEHEITMQFNDCLKKWKSEDACFDKSWDKVTSSSAWLKNENYRSLASEEPLVKSRLDHQRNVFKAKLLYARVAK